MRTTVPVGQLVKDPVATIRPTATIREAVDALVTDDVGLLVVVDPSGVRGVISERDVMAAIAEGLDLDDERVRDVASTEVITVEEDLDVHAAARAMADAGIRHLAVARRGVTVGVVSIRDVVGTLLDDIAAEV